MTKHQKKLAKQRAKRALARVRDELAMRESYAAKRYALGALQMLCMKAGKPLNWITDRVCGLFDHNENLRLFDVHRRIGACYVKFLPSRVAKAT